eukprot:TRINITY_DN594_c0_g1_i12.p1 TRINITY_DN594_c0_g1~~TRINITY_DN594_c0_g1_i12.p1  ORF type:complete len:102 (-),score=3.84 TRINITY_DN594_c0_g1_i12:595-900(-)
MEKLVVRVKVVSLLRHTVGLINNESLEGIPRIKASRDSIELLRGRYLLGSHAEEYDLGREETELFVYFPLPAIVVPDKMICRDSQIVELCEFIIYEGCQEG